MRTCVICGKDISDRHGNCQICSETCRKIRHNEQQRDYHRRDKADRAIFVKVSAPDSEVFHHVFRGNVSRRQGA